MKKSTRQILTVILLFTFLLGAGIGPALAQQQVKVNINKASVDELSTLKRIGPSYAQRIVDYRKQNGPFEKPEVSHQNWRYIKRYVPDVIPIYHWGKDLKYLERYISESEYVAVGGSADASVKKCEEQLDHLWETHLLDRNRKPRRRIHGLGLTSAPLVAKYPWFSVDSTSWALDAAYRLILVPMKSLTGLGYDHTKSPIRVSVTLRSTPDRNHISRLPGDIASHVMQYLEEKGFKLGKGYRSDHDHEPGLCNDPTMRYALNAIFYSEMGLATGTKVYLAGNFESMANPQMERSIRQEVFSQGLNYCRLVSFADSQENRMNIIKMKEEENHEIKCRDFGT